MKDTATGLLVWTLIVAFAMPAAASEDPAERRKVAARAAFTVLKEKGAEAAARNLEAVADPAASIGAFCDLSRHLYWKEKDLPRTVTLLRAGIRHGLEVAKRTAETDAAATDEIRALTKGLAYDLASFTWPGWGETAFDITPEMREAGLRAARLNLDLAKSLSKPPDKMSAAYWVLGAQLIAAGEHEKALAAFLTARENSVRAKGELEILMLDGYMGIALVLRGEREDGDKALREAVDKLTKNGSDDAKFYAEQLRTSHRIFAGERGTKSRRVECGPLVLDVKVSRTAHLFHVVDHLSVWSPLCRAEQYNPLLRAIEDDRPPLDEYTTLRGRKGWGGGLEQAFYTDRDLDAALFEGVKKGHFDQEEMLLLRRVLTHFAPRVDRLLGDQRAVLTAFVENLDVERLTRAATALSGFCGVEKLEVPCFPIATPGRRFGGGYNGGRLVIEVPRDQDPHTVLIHEIAHAFFHERHEEAARAARGTEGLDLETLYEGFAYAFAQGLYPAAGEEDLLAKRVIGHIERGEGLGERRSGARYRIYGLALRAVLSGCLTEDGIRSFLPRAVVVWERLSAETSQEK